MTESKATPEQNLRKLFNLQLIDSKLDRIRSIRGELPMEVNDLEDEIAGLQTRLEKQDEKIKELQQGIKDKKNDIKEAQTLAKKYESQQDNVKNNREYLAISKEIELQKLETMAAEKKIKDFQVEIEGLTVKRDEAETHLNERKSELVEKKKELKEIVGETEKEEKKYEKLREAASKEIEERLLKAYNRIRESFKNGLAVVTIQRESCGGCFSAVPPQRQLDIRQRKKVIVCENCGRVLIDNDLAEELKEEAGIAV